MSSIPLVATLLSTILAVTLQETGQERDSTLPLADYFRHQVEEIESRPLQGIQTAADWMAIRSELQSQLREMLSLEPFPPRTPLKAEIRGRVDQPDFVIEKILYQSLPGLYVTANLYRPRQVEEPLPAILYVCGHGREERDGVIFGNKAHYQHHAEWYAANGYVCLVVDTLQLGEVPGLHHGTARKGRWWWQSAGYTPAGIETWNGIRAIDYLCSRVEVDPNRLGVTGRSGGGATSWWLGALDDRLTTVIPVAGITDLRDHLVQGGPTGAHPDGVITGHCDCMYMVNTYRWDFPTLAALVAPKALLVENSDLDPIFPEAGVRRIYQQLENVYQWYHAADRLDLVMGAGGHADTEELRHPSFAFMETWLKGNPTEVEAIDEPDRRVPMKELRVLDVGEILQDARNDQIDETFVPIAEVPPVPESIEDWKKLREKWMSELESKVFAGWPSDDDIVPLNIGYGEPKEFGSLRMRAIDYTTEPGVRLRGYLLSSTQGREVNRTFSVEVIDQDAWQQWEPWFDWVDNDSPPPADYDRINTSEDFHWNFDDATPPSVKNSILASCLVYNTSTLIIPTRGIGSNAWESGSEDTQIRRRFALLGQTLDGMRVWDLRRALAVGQELCGWLGEDPEFTLEGRGEATTIALWAAVFEPSVSYIRLIDLPQTVRTGPAFLNLERIMGYPQALSLLAPRMLMLKADPTHYRWTIEFRKKMRRAFDWTVEGQLPH